MSAAAPKWVYLSEGGNKDGKELLGAKRANLTLVAGKLGLMGPSTPEV